MWSRKIYAYEIEGSCPFKIRPKLSMAYAREILNCGKTWNNTLQRKHKVLEVSNIADFHVK